MREVMYDHSSFMIVTLLFVALLIATEIGFRLGRKFADKTTKSTKSQINAIQGSILGVLALLLGFTFSLSLQRYDTRSQAVVAEANAVGTALLRVDLLPDSVRADAGGMLRQYLELRVKAGNISLDRAAERDAVLGESNRILEALWRAATDAARVEPNPVRTGLFVQALNDVIDSFGTRDAALNRHVPELVLFLMFATLILAASLVGYGSGVSNHRATFAAYTLLALIICLVFVIIDLDRPRRGLIEVSQQSLVELQASNPVTLSPRA